MVYVAEEVFEEVREGDSVGEIVTNGSTGPLAPGLHNLNLCLAAPCFSKNVTAKMREIYTV